MTNSRNNTPLIDPSGETSAERIPLERLIPFLESPTLRFFLEDSLGNGRFRFVDEISNATDFEILKRKYVSGLGPKKLVQLREVISQVTGIPYVSPFSSFKDLDLVAAATSKAAAAEAKAAAEIETVQARAARLRAKADARAAKLAAEQELLRKADDLAKVLLSAMAAAGVETTGSVIDKTGSFARSMVRAGASIKASSPTPT